MVPEIAIRLLITATVIGSGMALWWLANRLTLKRAAFRVTGIRSLRPGRPAILYFTSPTCAPCKTVQRPAIQALKHRLGDALQVVEIDASVQPRMADEWGVLSVPTTFVIDPNGQPRRVNHGVATADKLYRQLEEILR